jgi:hypothetical protein
LESEFICICCGKLIENNQGTYWVKGTGGIFSRGVYPDTVVYAHWGLCAKIAGDYYAKLHPDKKGEFWFWGHLPFLIQSDEQTTNSDRFIYVLKAEEYYKIGIAKNVDTRMKQHQTSNHVKLLFVCSCFSQDAPRFEKRLHRTFAEYRGEGEWFKLPPEKLEYLIEILASKDFTDPEEILPIDNIVYYAPNTRVLWRNQSGTIHSLVIKPYKFQVGYNIVLDSQTDKCSPEVDNSGYDELVLEENGKASLEGYEIEPEPIIREGEKTSFSLKEILEMD